MIPFPLVVSRDIFAAAPKQSATMINAVARVQALCVMITTHNDLGTEDRGYGEGRTGEERSTNTNVCMGATQSRASSIGFQPAGRLPPMFTWLP